MEKETVRVLVANSIEPPKGQQLLPDVATLLREKLVAQAVEVSVETLKRGIVKIVDHMLPIVANLPETNDYEVSSIDIALAVDSQGEISIVGTASAGLQISSGITVTIAKKQKVLAVQDE